jgi:hypothetical protein
MVLPKKHVMGYISKRPLRWKPVVSNIRKEKNQLKIVLYTIVIYEEGRQSPSSH